MKLSLPSNTTLTNLAISDAAKTAINHLIESADQHIRKNRVLPSPNYFLVSEDGNRFHEVRGLDNFPIEHRNAILTSLVKQEKAQCLICIAEAAILLTGEDHQHAISTYGSIDAHPDKDDIFLVSVHCKGVMANGMAFFKKVSAKKGTRKIGQMHWATETGNVSFGGRMSGYFD